MNAFNRKNGTRNKSFLKLAHSYALNLVLCLGLTWTHLPVYAADSSATQEMTDGSDSTGASSDDLSTSGSSTSEGASSGGTSSSNGNYTKIEGDNIDPTSKMLLSNIALFAATMAAPILIKQCKKAPSVWIYGGTAAIYLANEIGLFTRFKNASDAEMAAYLGRGDEDKQIDSLESAAEQTDKAKKAAKTRALIAKITAAGFAAATAMALVENYTSWVSAGGCGPGGESADAATGTVMNSLEEMKGEKEELQLYTYSIQENIDKDLLVMNSDNFDFLISYQEQIDVLEGKNQSITLDEYYQQKSETADSINSIGEFKSAILMATNFAIETLSSQAQAEEKSSDEKEKTGINWTGSGVKAMVGMLGAGAGVIAMNSSKIADSKMVKNPLTRAALFGGMSVFAIGAAKEASDAANKLDQRSAEYRKLANTLRTQVGQNTTTSNGSTNQTVSGTISKTDKLSSSGSDDVSCTTGGSTSSISVDESCACASSNSCKKTNMPEISAMPDFAGKSILSDSLKSLKSAGDNVYAGRLEGAATDAQSLSKNAARISKLRDALVKKINKDNVAAGGKGNYDLDKMEDKFQNQLLKSVNDSFKGLSPTEQASLARFAPALGEGEKTAESDSEESSSDTTAAVGGTGAVATGEAGNKSNQGSSWDFNFDEENSDTAVDPEAAALAEAMAKEDEDYVIEGDINDDRNKNIFKIITGRYLKSAYPVIFDEQ